MGGHKDSETSQFHGTMAGVFGRRAVKFRLHDSLTQVATEHLVGEMAMYR